jgi:hypothetical protein
MMLKPLPVGIQTFRDLIEGGFLYIDKTHHIYEMIRYSKGVYFLSRPRRFGKSLLISTLDEIFSGRRERFKGLWLYDSPYQWQRHPVIRFDFSRHSVNQAEQLEPAAQCCRVATGNVIASILPITFCSRLVMPVKTAALDAHRHPDILPAQRFAQR